MHTWAAGELMRIKDASTPPPCINALQRLVFSSGGLGSTVLIMGILALMWLVKGVGDHWSFFHQHQSRCSYLGAVFALQTLLLAPAPLVSPTFDCSRGRRSRTRARLASRLRLPGGAGVWHRTLPDRDLHDPNPAAGVLARRAMTPRDPCTLGDHRRQCGVSAERLARLRSSRRVPCGLAFAAEWSRAGVARRGANAKLRVAANSSGRHGLHLAHRSPQWLR